MKKTKQINLGAIRKNIKSIHNNFIDKVGIIPSQLDSEKYMDLNIVSAKLSAILKCFVDEKIIDTVEKREKNYDFVEYVIFKKGFCTSIIVSTNGDYIVFKDEGFLNTFSDMDLRRQVIRVENIESFDFENFSVVLLDYIHRVMYNRKASLDALLFK